MNLSRVGPGEEACHDVELPEEATDDLIHLGGRAELVELGHHANQRLLNVLNRTRRIELALLIETALAAHEFFAVEVRQAMKNGISGGMRIGEET